MALCARSEPSSMSQSSLGTRSARLVMSFGFHLARMPSNRLVELNRPVSHPLSRGTFAVIPAPGHIDAAEKQARPISRFHADLGVDGSA